MRDLVKKPLVTAALAAALLFGSGSALADGLAAKPSQLGASQKTLAAEIAALRKANPGAFDAVQAVNSHRPEVYKKFRNPIPTTAREFRSLRASALLPMLEALAFDAPATDGLTEAEVTALTTGMLEAVGVLRDPRSGPVLQDGGR